MKIKKNILNVKIRGKRKCWEEREAARWRRGEATKEKKKKGERKQRGNKRKKYKEKRRGEEGMTGTNWETDMCVCVCALCVCVCVCVCVLFISVLRVFKGLLIDVLRVVQVSCVL